MESTPNQPQQMRWPKTVISGGTALGLAVAASLWIALWPSSYQGVSQSSGPSGPLPPVKMSASFLQVNGLRGIIPLLIPILLASLGLLVSRSASPTRVARIGLWGLSALMLLFCGVAMFSIGIFYLPSAVAMLTTATLSLQAGKGRSAT